MPCGNSFEVTSSRNTQIRKIYLICKQSSTQSDTHDLNVLSCWIMISIYYVSVCAHVCVCLCVCEREYLFVSGSHIR